MDSRIVVKWRGSVCAIEYEAGRWTTDCFALDQMLNLLTLSGIDVASAYVQLKARLSSLGVPILHSYLYGTLDLA